MPKTILAKLVTIDKLSPPEWECQLCDMPGPHRTREVSATMIHLVTNHHIGLEFQSFPPGVLQEGTIFHLVASTESIDEKYKKLFQPSPYSDKS